MIPCFICNTIVGNKYKKTYIIYEIIVEKNNVYRLFRFRTFMENFVTVELD